MNQKLFTWPNKNAVIISQSPNIFMFLKELLRSVGWTVLKDTPLASEAIDLLKEKQAVLVIVDDSVELPCAIVLRQLLTHPIAFATPIFSFLLDENKNEAKALARLGEPTVAYKPLTPSRFIPSFSHMLNRWESKPYVALRAGINQYLLVDQPEYRINVLTKLMAVRSVAHLVAPALGLEYWGQGMVQEAEKTFLQQLKSCPSDLGCMISLSNLYMQAAMPQLAKRLLTGIQKIYDNSNLITADLVQAEMLLSNFTGALEHLNRMRRRKFWPESTLPYMARLLLAQGRANEAATLMSERKGLYQKITKAWEEVS